VLLTGADGNRYDVIRRRGHGSSFKTSSCSDPIRLQDNRWWDVARISLQNMNFSQNRRLFTPCFTELDDVDVTMLQCSQWAIINQSINQSLSHSVSHSIDDARRG